MPKAGNFHFIRSTKVRSSEVLSAKGASLWSGCDATFARIDALCGDGASRIFAEPNVKRQDGGDVLNVAWFGSHDDDPKELSAIDRGKLSRIEEDLVRRIGKLKPALNDPEIGETVAAMLNVYDHGSIMAVGEHAILTNWGALPAEATATQSAYARHTDDTVGRFIGSNVATRLPGKQWANAGKIEVREQAHVTHAAHAAPVVEKQAVASATPSIVATAPSRHHRWLAPAALVTLFGGILAYVAWPGNLVYERENRGDQGVLTQLNTANDELTRQIAVLQTEAGKNACEIDRALVGLPPLENSPVGQGG
ncbi:hypothetical protein FA04_03045 [Ensifer adhaerens]|uniref:Uncharacterized protein n=1 Tax=Ensifer adhaerens TaxID=106592 RepID=A0ABY8HHZ8_ENSAD|nr:hypothetical protein [Ensifer adhaerens]ANK71699.1 hypothetical protein FA04_03045 [Ensifer adhaerens]KDP71575.1 hypothetical protein FA04_22145 [Ensifer adhaerens]WFP91376.1 hypothetical protein P4B07_03070 [Ensifer adhaerens]